MNHKLKVDGKVADKLYNLRTTDDIYDTLAMYASSKGESVNVIMNIALSRMAKQIKSKTKPSKAKQ